MSEITGGQLLGRCLANEGVRFVFGLPCPEIDPLLAALDEHGIRLVPVRHEAAAAHMAEGLYKTTGQVAAVLGNPGPGSANLLPGVITARHEGVPLVAITSQHRLGLVYPSTPATFQGQDQLDVFRAAVKWGGPVLSLDRMTEVVAMAFREMWTGRPGPVQLEIPAPVLYDMIDESAARVLSPSASRAAVSGPSAAAVAEAVRLLGAASSPVIVAGAGVDRSGARGAVVGLSELLGCPLIGSMAGRSAIPLDHPNAFGSYSPGADLARREADVVLAVGTRLGNLDVPFEKYWGDAAGQKLIHVDVDPRNMGVTRPLSLGIVADANETVEAIVGALSGARQPEAGARAERLARYRAATDAWSEEITAHVASWSGAGIHPARAMEVVGRVFGTEAIYAVDGGNTSLWAGWFLPPTAERSYLNILELGMLGTGIPSAIGAKLANPERDVVCVTGDGAAGFNFMEMQSAAREGLNVTTIVFAEGAWSMEVPNEMMLYGKTFGTAMGEIRWDTAGEGLGCRGFYVDELGKLEAALESAKSGDGPTVVCVRTDRDANLATPEAMLIRFVEVYQGPMG